MRTFHPTHWGDATCVNCAAKAGSAAGERPCVPHTPLELLAKQMAERAVRYARSFYH